MSVKIPFSPEDVILTPWSRTSKYFLISRGHIILETEMVEFLKLSGAEDALQVSNGNLRETAFLRTEQWEVSLLHGNQHMHSDTLLMKYMAT